MEENKQSRTLFLTGPLEGGNGVPIINALKELDQESNDDITIIICSPGGRVDNMIGIIDTMDEIESDTATVILGGGASAAAAIATCGTKGKRYMSKHSEIMFHMARGGWRMTDADKRRTIHFKHLMEKILSDCSGHDMDKVKEDIRLEMFLNAEKAVEYGCIDHIL